MKRYLSALGVLALALGSTGCLVKETTHRLYLSPTGSVTWMVMEQGVRSNEDDAMKAWHEEREWLAAIETGAHPVAEGLRRLDPDRLSTRLLRVERPYLVLTDARFMRVDRVIQRFFEELGVRAEATLEADGLTTVLAVSLDLSSVDDPEPDIESPVTALLEDLDRYRLTLTDGRFVAATGFDLIDSGTTATLRKVPAEKLKASGELNLQLSWQVVR